MNDDVIEIDVDEVVGRLLPWNVGVKVKGKVYRVPPLTMGTLGLLMEMGSAPSSAGNLTKFREVAGSIFEPAPAADWEMTHYTVALQKVFARFKEWQEKNSKLLAAPAATDAGSPSGSGSSSPRS